MEIRYVQTLAFALQCVYGNGKGMETSIVHQLKHQLSLQGKIRPLAEMHLLMSLGKPHN